MSWLSKALKKSYRWKEKHLKPKELKKIEPAVPAIIGAFNPIAGIIAQGLHTARKGAEADWDREDAERAARIAEQEEQAAIEEQVTPPPEEVTPVAPTTPELQYDQYSGGLFSQASGGGVPVSMWPQLGSGIAQQTAAVRSVLAKASGRRGGLRSARRRKKRKSKTRRRTRRRSAKRGLKKLKKGSAAAKAWGRKMKALRKRRK